MAETLVGIFLESVDRYHHPAQFMRKGGAGWESISADRALADVERLALGLRQAGVGRGDRVAILSENRYEWPVCDLAILGLGAVSVPIYPTLTAHQIEYILQNAEARVVLISNAAQLQKLQEVMGTLPQLGTIVVMDAGAPLTGRATSFAQMLASGETLRAAEPKAFRESAAAVGGEDLATIIYTSGTTGEPKGAMLVHRNIVSNVMACLSFIDLNHSDGCLSFLPLCHIFERMAGLYAMFERGASIAYAESIDTVAANALEVRPTVLTGVPRFYEKVYARVMDNAATLPALSKNIFHWGLGVGRRMAQARFARKKPGLWLALQARIADKLVGAKIRERVGGRLRFCISGGAPLGPKVMEFFFAIGIPVLEGYGLTETSPVICLNRPGQEKPGSVGPPVPGVEARIGPDGEILTRGPHVMKGYFRNEGATSLAIRDGWFHTGDVGHFDADGCLFITDRLKDLLVTAGGKKVAPQPLEGRLKSSKWIAEAVLLGDQRPFVIALLVPNFTNLELQAKARGWNASDRATLLKQPEVQALYGAEIERLNTDLAPFEKVKKFALLDRDLSPEAGELTPTLKVRRRVIQEKFAGMIEGLYASHA